MTKKEFLSGVPFRAPSGDKYRFVPTSAKVTACEGHLVYYTSCHTAYHCNVERITNQTITVYHTLCGSTTKAKRKLSDFIPEPENSPVGGTADTPAK